MADIHLPPVDSTGWPARYRHAIEWWNTDSRDPHSALSRLLEEIRSRCVDFILFGGDILDYYDADTARHVVEMCRRRGLKAYFQIGNHDWEDANTRYVTRHMMVAVRRPTRHHAGTWWMRRPSSCQGRHAVMHVRSVLISLCDRQGRTVRAERN